MKLYLTSQERNGDYDTYDSAVVAAESAEQAQQTDPAEYYKWDGEFWVNPNGVKQDVLNCGWVNPQDVTVKLTGTAEGNVNAGVICASFNAE